MKDSNDNETGMDPLSGLLRRAGKRPQPPEDAVARIHAKVHAEWTAGVRQRRRRQWMAVAAAVVGIGLVGMLAVGLRDRQPPVVVAHAAAGDKTITIGERVEARPDRGLVLQTQTNGARSVAIRLAPGSALQFEAADHLRLLTGSVYIDTGEASQGDPAHLLVLADRASIEHVGTQFLVQLTAQHVNVAVRSGNVVVRSAKDSATFQRGELARIGTGFNGGPGIERLTVATSGETWAWADTLAPSLVIEGLSLHEALTSLSHEAGVELDFDSTGVEETARQTVLHGPALDLPPGPALHAILATTNLTGQAEPGSSQLLIRAR
jgi:ferric-dicitrate binding protein FerR (iron transport regulator)